VPGISALNEMNVRTYVRYKGEKPGVYFFSLDADSLVAVALARTLFALPYYVADIDTVVVQGEWVRYRCHRPAEGGGPAASFEGRYRPTGPVYEAPPGSLDYFLIERYCLYTMDDSFRAHRLQIHHPPWPLQPAEAEITMNTMAEAAGIRLPSIAPRLHFARRQDMVAWARETL
jgi:hypothetical protein